MKKLFFSVLLVFFFSANYTKILHAKANNNSSFKRIKGFDKIKFHKARHLYLGDNYWEALSLYKELHVSNAEDALLNYRMGECYVALENYYEAMTYLEKCLKKSQDIHKGFYLTYGKALHRIGELDRAIAAFEKFKQNKLNKSQRQEVNKLIEQCYFAKKLMEKSVNIKISNLGSNINSTYDDYAPSLSSDGKTMIFTSRRDDAKGGLIEGTDNKYYEDIYISTWNKKEKRWNKAEDIKGRLNTEFHDASLSISLDGQQIFLYKNIPNVTKSGDIYVSRLNASGEWSSPEPLAKTINSTYFESSACLTPDGNTLYFVSERHGGMGKADIYKCSKISQGIWGEAENLGAVINTPEDEISIFIHPDGKTLFFSSKGHNSMGGYDIFKSTLVNGKWTKPVNLGYPINSVNDDLHFVLTADNNSAYYSAIKPDGLGERDIYRIDMSKYSVVEETKPTEPTVLLSVVKGKIFDSETKQGISAEIYITDVERKQKIAHFASNNDGEYLVTLVANKKYILSLLQKGYVEVKENVEITSKEDSYTLIKDITLVRKEKLPHIVSPEATPKLFEVKQLRFAFEYGSADFVMIDISKRELDYLIDNMLKHENLKIDVSGHTDNVGSKEYNHKLSFSRANAVADYIVGRGIAKNRISVNAYGVEKPIAKNDTEEGKAKNRRVEVKLME